MQWERSFFSGFSLLKSHQNKSFPGAFLVPGTDGSVFFRKDGMGVGVIAIAIVTVAQTMLENVNRCPLAQVRV